MGKRMDTLIAATVVTMATLGAHGQVSAPDFRHAQPIPTLGRTAALDRESAGGNQLVVLWQNGQLSVTAHRVTLRSVLAAITKQTGLVVDSSGDADVGLVHVDLGPATMHDVLATLLYGDYNNYILVGSANIPGFVEHLVLSRADRKQVVATNQAPAPALEPELYGRGFYAAPDSVANEPAPAAEASQPPSDTALPSQQPQQPTSESTMARYQQAYNEMLKAGKSRAEILNELQQQQIRDLDAQAPAPAPPQP